VGRVWQSAVAPLADAGVISLAGASGSGLILRDIVATGENIVLADSAADPDLPAAGMSLSFMCSDPALNPRWLPPWQSAGWLIEVFCKSHPLTSQFAFTIGPLDDDERNIPPAVLPSATGGPEPTIGPGKHHLFEDRLWLEDANTVVFPPVPVNKEGTYWLWIQMRHSERSASETELTPHYQLYWDGNPVAFTWQHLDTYHTGNGYFGWAKFNLGSLRRGNHTLQLQTTHSWCALRRLLLLTGDEAYAP
jgi:hypothetical protein